MFKDTLLAAGAAQLEAAKAAGAAQFDSARHDAEKSFSKARHDAEKSFSKTKKKAAKVAAQKAALAAGYLPSLKPEKKPSALTRILGDLGTAIWFGGSVFGILSLNPSVEVLDDPEERGKMVDEAWARFQPYGAAGLLVAFIAHIAMRRRPPRNQTETYKIAGLAKDFFIVGAGITSIASLALGEYAVDDHQPVDSATEPTEGTPDDTQKAQNGLSIASIAQLTCGLGLIIAGAILASERDKA
ncbi:hypothetical protein IAD21_01013 [Abditibacteriota bacterium]|nr:hypothetical protein IAD21_01013 [Abditibacteriota bacterium]